MYWAKGGRSRLANRPQWRAAEKESVLRETGRTKTAAVKKVRKAREKLAKSLDRSPALCRRKGKSFSIINRKTANKKTADKTNERICL